MLHWQGAQQAATVIAFDPSGRRNAAPDVLDDIFQTAGMVTAYERNEEIFGEDEPAEHLYRVVSGVVRISKLMSDGRRQIGAFYLPGDVFGLDLGGDHGFSAEAVGRSTIVSVRKNDVLAHTIRDGEVAAQLWAATMVHLQRAQMHILLLGRKSAPERLAAFLLDMASRLSLRGEVELPMSRQDIADYLGLTIETVSRTLTQLERDGVIGIPTSRRIVFRDRATLDLMNDSLAA